LIARKYNLNAEAAKALAGMTAYRYLPASSSQTIKMLIERLVQHDRMTS
jgi:hypothetical protein